MRMRSVLIGAAMLAALPCHAATLALVGGTLIDGWGGKPLSNSVILIEDERISAIGQVGTLDIPAHARRISTEGMSVLPGLWDMHVHLPGADSETHALTLFLANGVTGVRDMSTGIDALLRWRSATAEGTTPGPRVLGAGMLVDGLPHVYPAFMTFPVTTPAEARHAVDSLVRRGVDFIKAYEMLRADVFAALADQARARGIPLAGHLPLAVSADDAVRAFFAALADLLERMNTWSADFDARFFEATAAFAAGVQKSVAGIGAAADALGKLVEFVAPAEKNVSAFFAALADLLEKMDSWSASFDATLFETTAAFANGVNASVAPLKGAIESLGKFTDFVPPAQKGVSAFFVSVGALLTQMGALAGQYSAEFFAGTILFGQNIAKSVESIKAAFTQMAGLADLKGIASGVLTSFTSNLTALLDELERQVAPAAENIGAALVFGIADGIQAQIPYLVATLQNAAATMVGQALGAGKPERGEQAVWTAGHYNAAFLGAVGVAFVVWAPQLAALFTEDPNVAVHAVDCLRIVSTGFLLFAYGLVLTQAFNGAGDAWTPTWINLGCFWVWQIPLAWWLALERDLGPRGVYVAITVAFSTLAVVSAIVFRQGWWKTKAV